MSDAMQRRPWREGPDEDASAESWLLLDDDALLHRIETLAPDHAEDERLLEVVGSDRHFFIRQEAAKRVGDRDRLFEYEDDRHVGQILVRHLTRREDVTYLQRLCARSTHKEVRSAAQVQLARLWRRQDAKPLAAPVPGPAAAAPPGAELRAEPAARKATGAAEPPVPAPAKDPDAAPVDAAVLAAAAAAPEPLTSAPLDKGWVDGSLLAWAAHFLIEPTWSHLGTNGTRELLTRTRRELLGRYPTLVSFEITPEAHVATNLDVGPRLPADAVRAVAAWMVAFRSAARQLAPRFEAASVRSATTMMADALRDTGFYAACDEAEAAARV